MDYIGVGMTLPENNEVSWTAISFDEYVCDMGLRGQNLSRQLAVDVPRMMVNLMHNGTTIRIHSGEVLEGLLRSVLQPSHADSILSFMTQTSLAAPMRALSNVLPDHVVVSEHDENRDMVICVHLSEQEGDARVLVEKTLALRDIESLAIMRPIQLLVEADTSSAFVMVGIV